MWESECLRGQVVYSKGLFDNYHWMLGHFQTLLRALSPIPSSAFGIAALTESERHQLVVEWNDTEKEQGSRGANACHLFEDQVERTRGSGGGFEDKQPTYRELNSRSNQLAHHLQQLGSPDVLVGICVERSVEMLVGLLGILKVVEHTCL